MAEAKVKIGIENSKFERGLNDIRGQIKSWKDDIKSNITSAFTFGAVLTFFNNLREEAGRINDLAARFNQTRQSIQQVSAVAKVSGTDIEKLASILEKLSISAADGAESFAKVGINAADFVAADYQGRILMLAGAWEKTNGNVQAQADLMALLGAKGADLLPMLSKGVNGLKEEWAAVEGLSDRAIQNLSAFNDRVEGAVQKLKHWASEVVGFFHLLGGAMGALAQNPLNYSKASAEFEKWQKSEKEQASQRSGSSPTFATAADAKAAADAQAKTEAARLALEEQMQTLARSRMSDEEKITDLERERAALAAKAQDAAVSEEDRLKAAQQVLQVQQEIEAIQNRLSQTKEDEAKKSAELKAAAEKKQKDQADKLTKDTLEAEGKTAAFEDGLKLEKMDPAQRAAELKRRQAALFAEEQAAQQQGDKKTAAEKRLQALGLIDDISAAEKEAQDKKQKTMPGEKKERRSVFQPEAPQSIVSSSLAALGGGGGFFIATGNDPSLVESRRQTKLLERIAANTGGEGGSRAEKNPF